MKSSIQLQMAFMTSMFFDSISLQKKVLDTLSDF